MLRLTCAVVISVAGLFFVAGCGRSSGTTPDSSAAARKFDEMHGGKTDTPYGPVQKGSAKMGSEHTVEYQTADGTNWQVGVKGTSENDFSFDNKPQKLK